MNKIEELIKELEELIEQISADLTRNEEISEIALRERVVIANQLDDKGKKLYSNDDQRALVLLDKFPDMSKELLGVKIRLEANRMRFNLNQQKINYQLQNKVD